MDTTHLPLEFQEFLKLLTEHRAEYVVIGGFAVSYHGYPRATGDIDLLINRTIDNAGKVIDALVNFGFERASLDPQMFLAENKIVRFSPPPL